MSTTALIPVDEYLRYSEKPNCEYRDGVLYPKPWPTTDHGLLEFMLAAMLSKLSLQAAPEVTVRLSHTKFLVPDVIAASVLQIPYPTEPVLLCCEILSSEDRLGTMLSKCEEYHYLGSPVLLGDRSNQADRLGVSLRFGTCARYRHAQCW